MFPGVSAGQRNPLSPPGGQEVAGSNPASPTERTFALGAVAWMVLGAGVSVCLDGGASVLVPGSGGGESLPVDLEQVVDCADESPLA